MSRKPLDLTNQRFGRLLALYPVGKDNFGNIVWRCQCDCENMIDVAVCTLMSENTQSCGCYRKEITSLTHTKYN